MSAALTWAEIEHGHLSALQNYVCTDPAKPKKDASTGWKPEHPRIWEYEAQQMIRAIGKKARLPAECTVLIGSDVEGLAAISAWTELEGPESVHLDVMGVAQRIRRPGEEDAARRAGTAAMRETLTVIENRVLAAGLDEMYVEGEIYEENHASLRMVQHFGFGYITSSQSGAETWGLRYRLSVAD